MRNKCLLCCLIGLLALAPVLYAVTDQITLCRNTRCQAIGCPGTPELGMTGEILGCSSSWAPWAWGSCTGDCYLCVGPTTSTMCVDFLASPKPCKVDPGITLQTVSCGVQFPGSCTGASYPNCSCVVPTGTVTNNVGCSFFLCTVNAQ